MHNSGAFFAKFNNNLTAFTQMIFLCNNIAAQSIQHTMNLIKAFALIAISLFAVSTLSAQDLSKAEKKKLKKELKQYKKNPVTYKKAKEKTKQEFDERDETIVELTKQLDQQNMRLRQLQDSLDAMGKKYRNMLAAGSTKIPTGTVYAVQIGYFELLQLEEFNSRVRTIRAENQDGGKRYVIGYFTNVEDAKKFGDEIKTIGIDDAFVSQYVDGKRIMSFDANVD
ncbi:MAG: putative coiled-coil protein SlyX [Bacteroidia bacterium]